MHWFSYSRSPFEAMDILYDPYSHNCCELALETWAMDFFINALGVHDLNHTHSSASLQWWGLSNQRMLLLPQGQKWSPYKGGVISMPICAKSREMAQSVPIKAFLQSAETVAMCTACRDYAPSPTLLATAKVIFKTVCANWYHAAKFARGVHSSSVVKNCNANMQIQQAPIQVYIAF